MADADRQRWNERFRASAADFTPARWLVGLRAEIAPRAAGSVALDLASGAGRNALFLAELGYRVEAWDISDVALGQLGFELLRRATAGDPLAVDPLQVDLDRAVLPVERFDLILDAHFLDRRLLVQMPLALRPGGIVVVQTFLHVPGSSRQTNPAFELEPGELQRTFAEPLEVIALREDTEAEEAHLVARRPYSPERPR